MSFSFLKRISIILILLLAVTTLRAQQLSSVFSGVALNVDTNEPVAFATIQVVNRKKGMASTEAGQFKFEAQLGDEIKISSIGYHDYVFLITEEHLKIDEDYKVYMVPKTYVLDSIVVVQMKDNFYLKKPRWDTLNFNNPYLNTTNPTDWSKPNVVPNTDGTAGFAITGFLNGFDKDLQQKKRLEMLKKADKFKAERKAEIEKRFNKTMVKDITDIDDRVIQEFMTFCDFRDGEILRATEYEMTVKILAKYKLFLRR